MDPATRRLLDGPIAPTLLRLAAPRWTSGGRTGAPDSVYSRVKRLASARAQRPLSVSVTVVSPLSLSSRRFL